MSEHYSFKGNNSLSRDKLNYDNGSLRNIHYGDIHTKFALLFHADAEPVPYINDGESHSAIRPENYCVPGDMVFADVSEDMEDVGKAIEIIDTGDVPLVCGLHTILARPSSANFALGFGAYLFSSGAIRKQIQREAQGAKVLGLSATRLGNVKLHYPSSTKEQQKIADCLSSLDALIAAQADKIDALKTHKKGLMQQLFPREGETVPRLRFPEFRDAGEWGENTFGGVARFINGRAYKQDELLESGRYRVLRVGNFFSNKDWYFSNLELEEDKYCDDGDLLYAWSASFGPRIWRGGKVIYHYHIWKVEEKPGVNRDFLFVLLDYETERMKSKSANGLGLLHITKATIESWECALPEPEEQQKIADCLSSLDALIAAHTERLEALKSHKKGLMQQLFPSPEAVSA